MYIIIYMGSGLKNLTHIGTFRLDMDEDIGPSIKFFEKTVWDIELRLEFR